LSVAVLFLLVLFVKMGPWRALLINPTAQFSYAGIFILYLCSLPSRYEAASVGLAGLIIQMIASNSLQYGSDYWLEPFFRLAGFIGLAGIGVLGIRSGFGRSRRHGVAMLLRILIFAVLGVFLGLFVGLASQLRPLKLDAYLFAIEQAYGLPHALATQWSAASPWLMQLELLVYYSLPLGLAVVYAAHLKCPAWARRIAVMRARTLANLRQ
jgi:hypothetical protein